MDLREQLQEALGSAYALERELSGGAMSRVFVAEERALGRKVVIKVLPLELSAVANLERFKQEIQLAAQLRHPHIVPLLTAGAAGELLYYTMPFVEGESLRAYLSNRRTLPRDEATLIAREVADALAYAHAHGVIHRDIKPENILLDSGHAIVTDFGIARAVRALEAPAITGTGLGVGTPAYMSPEQRIGDRSLDARSDIYSLGCVLYEMIAGRSPAEAGSAVASAAKHLRAFGDLLPVLAKSLAVDPSGRFENAEDFRDALSARPRGRHPSSKIVLAGAIGLMALTATGLWLVGRFEPRHAASSTIAFESVQDVAAHVSLARESYYAGRYGDAIVAFERIARDTRVPPGHRKDALRYLSRSYLGVRQPDSAKAAMKRLLDLEPPMILLVPKYETADMLALYYDARRDKAASQKVVASHERPHTVAVYSFFSYTLDPEWSDVARGVSDLLVVSLLKEGIRLVDREHFAIDDSVDSTYYAVESVRRGGKIVPVTDVILGSVSKRGSQVLVSAWAFDVATGRPSSVQQFLINAPGAEQIIDLGGRMAAGFARDLRR